MDFLSSGSDAIDRLLGGGFPFHQISLLYGEAATGKTILSMQCVLEAARKEYKVFYLDSDQSFSANRMEGLAGGRELAERIVLFRPEDFDEQGRIVENIENLLTKTPTLVVVDSITGLYRGGQVKPEGYFGRDRELNRQLAQLDALASRFAAWILLTGQVHSSPTGGEWLVEPVATRTLRHWSDLILRLTQTPRSNVRDCFLEKKNGLDVSGNHCPFKITDEGIEEA
ncbi:MAG TPA: ATPase domain-containing protein [Candidatus Limnocylindrales bacterium]|nr:ATPase domain-containing protein [Candidatus Limnocylindrales bacterium]